MQELFSIIWRFFYKVIDFAISFFVLFKITRLPVNSSQVLYDLECEREQKCCDYTQGQKRLCCNENCNFISDYDNFPKKFFSCKLHYYLSFTLAFVFFVIILFFIIDFWCIKKSMNYEQDIRRKFRRLAIVYV